MPHGDTTTFPRKADDFGFIPWAYISSREAVGDHTRDWGNELIRKMLNKIYPRGVGVETFKAEVFEFARRI